MTWARRDGARLVLEDPVSHREVSFERQGCDLAILAEDRDRFVTLFGRGADAVTLSAWLAETWADHVDRPIGESTNCEAATDAPPTTASAITAVRALEGIRAVAGAPASMPPHEVPAWVERKLSLLRHEVQGADAAIEDIAKAARFPARETITRTARAALVEHVGALRRRQDETNAAAEAATPIGEMRGPRTLKVPMPESDADDVPAIEAPPEAPPEAVQRANEKAETGADPRGPFFARSVSLPMSARIEPVAGGRVQFRGAIARALGEFENASDEILIKRAGWLRGEAARLTAPFTPTAGIDSGYALGERGVPRTRAGDLMRLVDEAREREARQADEAAVDGVGPLRATWLKARAVRQGFESLKTQDIGQQPTDQTAEACGINALKWAAAFCEANPHPDPETLQVLMAGWFALAIQRALDLAGKARGADVAPEGNSLCYVCGRPRSAHAGERPLCPDGFPFAGAPAGSIVDAPLPQEEREQLRQARGNLEALKREAAGVNELYGVIAFLMGVLDRVRRSTTLSAAWSYAAAGEDRIARWHLGAWQPGPHDDPAQWAGVKLTTLGPVTDFETADRDTAELDAFTRSLAEVLGCEAHPIAVRERARDLAARAAEPVETALRRVCPVALFGDRLRFVERDEAFYAEDGHNAVRLGPTARARLLGELAVGGPGARAALANSLAGAVREALKVPPSVADADLPAWVMETGQTHQAMVGGLARAAARYEQAGLMVRGDGSLWDDDMRNALAAAREAGLAPPPAPLDPSAARALWVPSDAVVLTDADARAFREFQRASIAMEDAHRAYADRQREHNVAMVTLGRAAAASGRAANAAEPAK